MTALVFDTIALVCLTIRIVFQTTALVSDIGDFVSHTIQLVCHTIGMVWLSKKVLCLSTAPNRAVGSPPSTPSGMLASLFDAP